MPTFNRNTEKNGLEISFEGIPDESVRTELKNNGFRWHRANKFWYAKETPDRLALVERMCGKAATTVKKSAEKTSKVVAAPVTATTAVKAEMNKRCCYSSSLKDFFGISLRTWLAAMKSAFSDEYVLSLGASQERAWKDCFDNLQKYLPLIDDENKNFGIVFEYALPYESGRRPDVLLVSKEQVIILEFKMKNAKLIKICHSVNVICKTYYCINSFRNSISVTVNLFYRDKRNIFEAYKFIFCNFVSRSFGNISIYIKIISREIAYVCNGNTRIIKTMILIDN